MGWRGSAPIFGSRGGCGAARYDLVIDLHGGPRSAWLALATGAPARIGYAIPGRTLDVHDGRGTTAGATAAPLGGEPVGPARGDRRLACGRPGRGA